MDTVFNILFLGGRLLLWSCLTQWELFLHTVNYMSDMCIEMQRLVKEGIALTSNTCSLIIQFVEKPYHLNTEYSFPEKFQSDSTTAPSRLMNGLNKMFPFSVEICSVSEYICCFDRYDLKKALDFIWKKVLNREDYTPWNECVIRKEKDGAVNENWSVSVKEKFMYGQPLLSQASSQNHSHSHFHVPLFDIGDNSLHTLTTSYKLHENSNTSLKEGERYQSTSKYPNESSTSFIEKQTNFEILPAGKKQSLTCVDSTYGHESGQKYFETFPKSQFQVQTLGLRYADRYQSSRESWKDTVMSGEKIQVKSGQSRSPNEARESLQFGEKHGRDLPKMVTWSNQRYCIP